MEKLILSSYYGEARPTLGHRIHESRLRQGLTLAKLSSKSGISASAIKNTESGKHDPSLFTLVCIADALNESLDYLVKGERRKNDRLDQALTRTSHQD